MTKYKAAIIGLSPMGAGALPEGIPHTGMGIEWSEDSIAASVSHASAFAVTPDVTVTAVSEINQQSTHAFLENYGDMWPGVKTYSDYKEMLRKESIDLLGVATPDHLHAQIVIDAVDAGVSGILCEKPISTTLADADRMIEACEKAGVAITVDHFRRYRPHWNRAFRELWEGPLGNVRRIIASYGGPRSMLFRNGSHMIDAVCWYAQSEPDWVIGVLDEEHGNYGPKYIGDGGKNPDFDPGGSVLVQFKNGVRAFINISKGTSAEMELDIFTEKGRLRINNQSAEVWHPISEGVPITLTHRTLAVPMTLRTDTPAAIADLINSIENGTKTCSPPEEARKSLAVILATLQSQSMGNIPIKFPIKDQE